MNNKVFLNKNAVITGAKKGIGKAILLEFVKNGANCICCVRNFDANFVAWCKKISKKYKVKIDIVKIDFSNTKNISQGIVKIFKITKKIDILVNNVGVLFNSLFVLTSEKKLRELFEVNYFSHVFLSQSIAREMIKNKSGNIIFISSTSAEGRDYGRFAYSSSKAAVSSLTRVISGELAQYGIRVNSICPGLTETDLMKNNTQDSFLKKELSNISLNRIALPKEIANLAVFLASNLSSYINGQNIRIDGGLR